MFILGLLLPIEISDLPVLLFIICLPAVVRTEFRPWPVLNKLLVAVLAVQNHEQLH